MLLRVVAVLGACTVSDPAFAQSEPTSTSPFDFGISRRFLTDSAAQRTFLPAFKSKMHSRSSVHTLATTTWWR
jgi:hypothetical protein